MTERVAATHGRAARHNERGMRVLIIDDDRALRDALRRALALAGYEIDAAAGGEEALARSPDAARTRSCSTSACPGVDGLEVCRRLRARRRPRARS